jgi:uncharacterized protein YgiM (DUF1202 family)
MKKIVANKKIIALFTLLFLFGSTGPAVARYYRYPGRPYHGGPVYYHGHSHGHSSGDVWFAWGLGLLTGGLISYMVNTPPPPRRITHYTYEPPPRLPACEKLVVTALRLNVRSGPGFNHAIMGEVALNEALDVLGSAPGWFYVRTPSGLCGWVMDEFTAAQTIPVG